MPTMYETIMDLPLFKGIGEEQLSQMLEKTSMEFLRFDTGMVISRPDDPVKALDFIISGKLRLTYHLKNFNIKIEEIIGAGAVVGALHLYGMETNHIAEIAAIEPVSIMRLEKSQYINILKSDSIYILNFVNYLSAAAQKSQQKKLDEYPPSISESLQCLAYPFVSSKAESLKIIGDDEEMAKFCGVTYEKFIEWKDAPDEKEGIRIDHEGIWIR